MTIKVFKSTRPLTPLSQSLRLFLNLFKHSHPEPSARAFVA